LHDGKIGGLADRGKSGHHVKESDEAVVVNLDLPPPGAPHHVIDLSFWRRFLDVDLGGLGCLAHG
jgi:hypothetical protein